tara:strand:+ start:41820 stop:42098 length:279 start_codon:yes stop_codon:yes gene_type:complete
MPETLAEEKTNFEVALYLVYMHFNISFEAIQDMPATKILQLAESVSASQTNPVTVFDMKNIFIIREKGLDYYIKYHISPPKAKLNRFDVMEI